MAAAVLGVAAMAELVQFQRAGAGEVGLAGIPKVLQQSPEMSPLQLERGVEQGPLVGLQVSQLLRLFRQLVPLLEVQILKRLVGLAVLVELDRMGI